MANGESSGQQVRGQSGAVGRMYGDYRILAELARGGMGRVYLAVRGGAAGFSRHFAVKVMNHQFADDQEALLMLLDEAHIASRLHHPNIVPVLDIGTVEDSYYLVMDYVEGCSLHQLMRRNKNYRPARLVVPIILGALNGLQAVHQLKDANGQAYNVVHRDISPQNLMIGRDGGCRVTDFGIAKAEARFTDTQTGMHKGKIAYMAPEQLLGEDVGPQVDVWAMGVTLYAALTAKPPFRGKSDAATMHNILKAAPPLPSTVAPELPPALDDIVMKALALDPGDRYPTAKLFAEALRSVALQNDLLGAPSEVAEWIQSSFGDELTERRRMIGELQGPGPSGDSRSLPKLWLTAGVSSLSGDTPLSHSGMSGPRVRKHESDAPTAISKPQALPQAAVPQAAEVEVEVDVDSGPSPVAMAEAPEAPSKRRFLVPIALVGLLAVAGILFAVLRGDGGDSDTSPSASDGPELAAAQGVEPSVEEPSVEEPSVEEPSVEEPSVEEPSVEPVAEPTVAAPARARPVRPRPRTPRPVAAPEPAPEPAPVAEPETPQPRALERNPYLRGE